MSLSPDMRAGDEDRDRTITRLREAFAEGRLSSEEFQQRMERAHDSRTFGDLEVLLADLPEEAASPAVVAPPATTVAVPEQEGSDNLRKGWLSWLGVGIMVNVIWVATWLGDSGDGVPYYWPIWVIGPWGAGMLIATLNQRFGGRSG